MMGYSTRSQGLPVFKIQDGSLVLVHGYPKLFYHYIAEKYLPFCEKDEVDAVVLMKTPKLWPKKLYIHICWYL